MSAGELLRILYICPGYSSVPQPGPYNRFETLSLYLEGDVLQPAWDPEQSGKYQIGTFQLHLLGTYRSLPVIKQFRELLFYLRQGYSLSKKYHYDAIVSYGTTRTGLAGYILKLLTGTKLILEVPGEPQTAFLYDKPVVSFFDKLRNRIGLIWTSFVLCRGDLIRLYFPTQVDVFSKLQVPKVAFPEFVAVTSIAEQTPAKTKQKEPYIFFLGWPWYLKGVDLLIEVFRRLAPDYPELRLKVVGFSPDREHFVELAGGLDRIELLGSVKYPEAVKLMQECTLFVLPTRTEGMPRVLVEAMAADKPIVASRVGGIPHYLKDNQSAFLFESGNSADLERALRAALSDPENAGRIAARGHQIALQEMNERLYAEKFAEMVKRVRRKESED